MKKMVLEKGKKVLYNEKYKRRLVPTLLAVVLTSVSIGGCAAPGGKMDFEETLAVTETVTDTAEENMTKIFMNAPGAWVGDVMATAGEDGIQFNYLYDMDYNEVAYHPIHRFTTKNLFEYRDEGEVIPYGTEMEAPDLAVGTGSFLLAEDGSYHCFYTGHNDKAAELGIDKECIMHAVSEDNKIWEKLPEDTFYAPDGYSSDDFRDPQVFWNEEADCYYMLVGARVDGSQGGIVALYTSKDLSKWELQDPFYEQDELYFLECPDVFKMGDYYYLVYSWNNVTYYRMSKSMNGPWEKPAYDVFDGNAFYAAKTVEYEGKWYLAGFVDRKKSGLDEADYNWAGSLCVYELVQKEDGTLGATLPEKIAEEYLTKEWKPEKAELIGGAVESETGYAMQSEQDAYSGVRLGTLPQTLLMMGTISFEEGARGAGFAFGDTGSFDDAYAIWMDATNGMLRYDKRTVKSATDSTPITYSAFRFQLGVEYKFKLVVENEVIVLYLDDTKVLSNRIYKAPGNGFGLFGVDGKASFSDLRMYVPKS